MAGEKEDDRTSDEDTGFDFAWEGVEELAGTYDLCATGPAFDAAINDGSPDIGRCANCITAVLRGERSGGLPFSCACARFCVLCGSTCLGRCLDLFRLAIVRSLGCCCCVFSLMVFYGYVHTLLIRHAGLP